LSAFEDDAAEKGKAGAKAGGGAKSIAKELEKVAL
jgi:hypothetical protein